MRNIYFVEFGTYNFDTVVDKIIFPVETIGKLSMETAENKLSHLKNILHKNCVVSITSGVVLGEFSEIYNLENGTLRSYDATYTLITVIDREISTENFPTFEEARHKMIEEVFEDLDEELLKNYYVYRDAEGNYEGDEFGIEKTTAWSNCVGRDDYDGDWRIIVC